MPTKKSHYVDDDVKTSDESDPNQTDCLTDSTKQNEMTAAETCKVLSTALENAMLKIRKECDLNDHEMDKNAIGEFVSVMSSSLSDRQLYLDAMRSVKFQKHHARRLFSALYPILKHTFDNEHYVPLSAFEDESCDGEEYPSGEENQQKSRKNKRNSTDLSQVSDDDDYSVVPDEASTQALMFIKYCAMIVHAFLDNQSQRRVNANSNVDRVYDMIEELYVVAELLHNNLFALNSCGREGVSVQREIIAMCEAYWKGQFSDREELVTQLIPLLVVKSLNGNATNADIKRLLNMKEALRLLDFQEKSTISELRNLLLKTVTSALFLKNADGRKMIAFLFQLDVSLVQDLHHSIRIQIPYSKVSTLEAYGEIYVNAWKNVAQDKVELGKNEDDNDEDSEGSTIQSAIEDVLQDLMVASLHAPSPHVAKNILSVLSAFFAQKGNPLFDDLLYHMYNPILWRALSAANPLIRIHASTILHMTFPLEDPNSSKGHSKEVMSKTIDTFISLLNDDDPKVRIAGCDAAIRIMGVCWNLLRSDHIRSLLNEIVMKHVNDSSSAAVRTQAVKGITLLLDAPASHGVLRPLLPLVGNHIHDSVERVRLECVKMLLKLRGIKGFKYYHIVPSQHILSRLAAEGEVVGKATGPVASAITELLINSFFPKGAKGSDQMRRTLEFINQNPSAARVFYANISNHLEVNYISKLIVMLFKTLKIGVEKDKRDKSENKSRKGNYSDETDVSDNEESEQMRVSASNTHLMAGVSETLSTVWSSIYNDLTESDDKQCLEFIQNSISLKDILQVCAYFEDMKVRKISTENPLNFEDCDRVCTFLLCCTTFISSENAKEFCSLMSSTINKRKDVKLLPYYAALCSWGLHDEVAFSLSKAIDSTFPNNPSLTKDDWGDAISSEEHEISTRGKRKRPSCLQVRNEKRSFVPDIPHSKDAIEMMGKILSGNNQSAAIMRERIMYSEIASSAIESSLMKATITAERIITQTVSTLITIHSHPIHLFRGF